MSQSQNPAENADPSLYVDPMTGETEELIDWSQDANEGDDGVNDLLGFDFESMETEDRTGLRALIGSGLVAHRRLPALEVIFERASRLMTTTLRHHAGDAIDASLESVSSARFGEFHEEQSYRAVFAPINNEGLDGFCLMTVDTHFIFAIVDYLLGGRRTVASLDGIDHSFTSIELALVRRMLSSLCDDFSKAFENLLHKPFSLEKVETNPRFSAITSDNAGCVIAKYKVDLGETTGSLRMLIPYAALEPVQARLQNEYIQENSENRKRWRRALVNEIATSQFTLTAVLAQKQATLGDIAALKLGDTIGLDVSLGQDVSLMIGNRKIASGPLGRSGKSLAISLEGDVHTDSFHKDGESQS